MVDLSAFPTRQLLRWNLVVRMGLAVIAPLAVQYVLTGNLTGTGVIAALVAGFVSFGDLGPDVDQPRWTAVTVVATPMAVVAGAVLGPSPTGGLLIVFLLYLVHGALTEAGLVSQVAWFPVSALGLIAAVLSTGTGDVVDTALAAAAGSAWAAILLVVTPRFLHDSRLPIPPAALKVDTDRLRRMVRSPAWVDWHYPLLLGALATVVLVVADAVTGGFRPYWAVFALVGVLGPSPAAARQSGWETVASTLAGIALAAVMLSVGLDTTSVMVVAVLLLLIGTVLLLRHMILAKILMTPLPVILAAAALGANGSLALGLRLVEYVFGAGIGLVAAIGGGWLAARLSTEQADSDSQPDPAT